MKVAPHESPTSSQQSSAEGEGESTPEEPTEGHAETATPEQPMSLSDLLGFVIKKVYYVGIYF